MALEKFEYPIWGTVTHSWLPAIFPTYPEFALGLDLGVASKKSAGGQLYAQGLAQNTRTFERHYQYVSEAERAAYEAFRVAVGGDRFLFTDELGVVRVARFADYALRWPAMLDRWEFSLALRVEESLVVPDLSFVPSGLRPNVLFYAALTANLSAYSKLSFPTFTFARNSPATYTDPVSGLLATAAANAPRFETAGISFERAATNLFVRSSELNLSPWSALFLSTVNVNAVAGPSGAVDFETIVEDNNNQAHAALQQGAAFSAGSKITYSFDAKPGARGWLALQILDPTFTHYVTAWFDLSAGTVGSIVVGGAASAQAHRITVAPNGCYRCSVSGILDGSSTSSYGYCYISTGNGVVVYAGNGVGSIHGGNAQMELGDLPTSRIATAGAIATRNADDLTLGETGHAKPSSGTIIFLVDVGVVDSGADAYQLFDAVAASGTTGVEIVIDGNAVRARVYSGGATVANLTGGAVFTAGVTKKIGLAWQVNDFRLVIDGAQVASDSSGAAPTALHGTTLTVGKRANNTRRLIGHIRKPLTFDVALSSADIITIQSAI